MHSVWFSKRDCSVCFGWSKPRIKGYERSQYILWLMTHTPTAPAVPIRRPQTESRTLHSNEHLASPTHLLATGASGPLTAGWVHVMAAPHRADGAYTTQAASGLVQQGTLSLTNHHARPDSQRQQQCNTRMLEWNSGSEIESSTTELRPSYGGSEVFS